MCGVARCPVLNWQAFVYIVWCCQVPCTKLVNPCIHCVVLPGALSWTPVLRLSCRNKQPQVTTRRPALWVLNVDSVPSFVTGECVGGGGEECLYTCYDPVSQDPLLCTSLSCANEMLCELSSFIVWGIYDIVEVDRLDPQMAEAGQVCAWSECFVTDGGGFEGRGY